MRQWLLIIDTWTGSGFNREIRIFYAKTGDDCFLAIRSESLRCVAGYQLIG
jgi:hypothetical protein